MFVCAASPTEISEVARRAGFLSKERAGIRMELAWLFATFDVGFAREKKKAQDRHLVDEGGKVRMRSDFLRNRQQTGLGCFSMRGVRAGR